MAGIGVEIRADAVLQADRLADVDDRPLGIFHQVTTGFGWEGSEDTLDVIGNVHHSNFITLHRRSAGEQSPSWQLVFLVV
jgi:hypothetical protein